MKEKRRPLVSICIPNYNYGSYLGNCFDSILKQTYDNIEVLFRDNNSTDNSMEVALSYKDKFDAKGIYYNISYNKRNVGSDKNSQLLEKDIDGEFTYFLASDDSIEPTFVETCVDIFDEFPDVSTVIVNRKEIDENGLITETVPFYNRNCVIDKESQAAVYMMSGIAIPGQRMFRQSSIKKIEQYRRICNVAGDWYLNFLLSMVGNVAYIKESLMQYRVHTGNETNESEKNMLGIFEHFQLINSFVDISKAFGMTKPAVRYNEAVEKLGTMCLRYALKMFKNGNKHCGHKYLLLAPVFKTSILTDKTYTELLDLLKYDDIDIIKFAIKYEKENNLNRGISYEPPCGFIPL